MNDESRTPPAPARSRTWSALGWGLVPLLSLGSLTVVPFVWWTARTKKWIYAAAGGLWTVLVVTAAVLVPDTEGPWDVLPLLLWLGGVVAVVLTGLLAVPAVGPTVEDGNRDAVRDAMRREVRREEARALLVKNPGAARDLRIGRPDLPRQYDDGGLLDANAVPAATLVEHLGWTPEQAADVVAVRTRLGRFADATEVIAYTDLPPATVDAARPLLVFSR
ncbi:hypothetical protein ACIO3O_40280 [Streptomyces sp. NPDC087440]|uniref:hypothetical protein n=1 Tax=Streptomyces sp. NPDC087440 TaxID=3365790 RepID=UPI0038286912